MSANSWHSLGDFLSPPLAGYYFSDLDRMRYGPNYQSDFHEEKYRQVLRTVLWNTWVFCIVLKKTSLFQQDRRGLVVTTAHQKCLGEYVDLRFSTTQISPSQTSGSYSVSSRALNLDLCRAENLDFFKVLLFVLFCCFFFTIMMRTQSSNLSSL